MVRVLVVDAHPGVRTSVVGILSDEPDVTVDAVGTARQADVSVGERQPDVILVDADLPDATGAQACAMLRAQHGRVRIVVMSGFPWHDRLLDAFEVGARGFVIKDADPTVIRHAVRSVANGGVFVDARAMGRLVELALGNTDATPTGAHVGGSAHPGNR